MKRGRSIAGPVLLAALVIGQGGPASGQTLRVTGPRPTTAPPEQVAVLNPALAATPGAPQTVTVPIDGIERTVSLHAHSVRADGYRLLLDVPGGPVEIQPGPVRTLRGSVDGMPGAIAAASLHGHGLHMAVRLADGRRLLMEPIAGGGGAHAWYPDTMLASPGTCGVTEPGPVIGPAGDIGGVAGEQKCFNRAELGCDADHEFYVLFDSSASAVEAEINQVVNQVNVQYESDVSLTHEITVIIVRTQEPDPYNNANADILLTLFGLQWNTQVTDPFDVAQLFTGKDIFTSEQGASVIGKAQNASVCTDASYSIIEAIANFACQADLSAHELGHNWSADHCGCASFTMNPSLTCTNRFHPVETIPEIVNYHLDAPCLDLVCIDPPPSNDSCGTPTFVSVGDTAINTAGALTDGLPEDGCGTFEADTWYRYFNVQCDEALEISVDADFPYELAVYGSSCPAGPGDAIGCAVGSSVTIPAAVQQYTIRVGGVGGATGTGTLGIGCAAIVQCPTDTDANGATDVDDLVAVILSWGSSDPDTDVDGSGTVDVDDLVAVILAWGPC